MYLLFTIADTYAYLALPEGIADGDEPFQGDGDNAVDAAGEGNVDEGEGEGGEVGQEPDVEMLGEGGQAVLHKDPALKGKIEGQKLREKAYIIYIYNYKHTPYSYIQ